MDSPRTESPEPAPPAIGIDLGTTTCAVARLVDDQRLETCPLDGEETLLPSVLFLGASIEAGERSFELGLEDPESVIEAFKREMGEPHFHRPIRGQWVPPEVLSAMLLDQIRQRASARLGPVRDAVITVPAYFDERRRRATLEAGELAGLNVLDIVNEPVAAALAELHHRGLLAEGKKNRLKSLVYDLGGGTFDVSVLEVNGTEVTTLSAEGDIRLGGRDFDELLVDLIAERFADLHGVDPRSDFGDAQRLWLLARRAKHELSERAEASVVCRFGGVGMRLRVTRGEFERLLEPFLERTLLTANDALHQAGLGWSDLDQVLLVGGSTRIPAVAAKLRAETGLTPTASHDPDLAVAHGAALFAAMPTSATLKPLKLINVNAHSLGIAGFDQASSQPVNRIMIPRNSRLPASKQQKFVTIRDNQKTLQVKVVEGENADPSFCVRVGTCVVSLEPDLPARTEVIVTMQLSSNGTLSVACKVPSTGNRAHAELRRDDEIDLESLAVWEERLLTGTATEAVDEPDLPSVPAIESPDPLNLDQVIKRIDYLCQEIASRCEALELPPAIGSAQRQYAAARREHQLTRYILQRVRDELSVASEAAEHAKLKSSAATAKAYLRDAERLLVYSRIAFGAACVDAAAIPEEIASWADEVRSLRRVAEKGIANPRR